MSMPAFRIHKIYFQVRELRSQRGRAVTLTPSVTRIALNAARSILICGNAMEAYIRGSPRGASLCMCRQRSWLTYVAIQRRAAHGLPSGKDETRRSKDSGGKVTSVPSGTIVSSSSARTPCYYSYLLLTPLLSLSQEQSSGSSVLVL